MFNLSHYCTYAACSSPDRTNWRRQFLYTVGCMGCLGVVWKTIWETTMYRLGTPLKLPFFSILIWVSRHRNSSYEPPRYKVYFMILLWLMATFIRILKTEHSPEIIWKTRRLKLIFYLLQVGHNVFRLLSFQTLNSACRYIIILQQCKSTIKCCKRSEA